MKEKELFILPSKSEIAEGIFVAAYSCLLVGTGNWGLLVISVGHTAFAVNRYRQRVREARNLTQVVREIGHKNVPYF